MKILQSPLIRFFVRMQINYSAILLFPILLYRSSEVYCQLLRFFSTRRLFLNNFTGRRDIATTIDIVFHLDYF